ncbi:MAG: outer membrane protein assembly factor BamB, partial [Flavobacteriales bacterium]
MNRYYLFSIIFFFSFSEQLAAQDTFSKRLSLDHPNCVMTSVEVTDSCYYASGIILDSISPYQIGFFFSRFGLEGELIFAKTLTDSITSFESWYNMLHPLSEGNFIVAAFSSYAEGLLIKLTPEGDTLFKKNYYSPYALENSWFVMRDLVLLPDGGFAFVAIIGTESLDYDILLVRTDPNGAVIWQKILGEVGTEIVHSLLATNDGGLLIGAGKADLGLYMVKTDSEGETEWIYTAPIPLTQGPALEMFQLPNDDFIVSSTRIMETPGGVLGVNPFLFRLNSAMEWDWEVNFFDSLAGFDNILTKILPLPDNEHFLAAGSGFVTLSDGNQNVGKLIKASYQGDSIWTRYYHHTEKENARNLLYDLEATPDGGFIMCGQATGIENPSPENPNQQGWLLKVDEYG